MRLIATIDGKKQVFPLSEGSSDIGRSKNCSVRLRTKGVSRRHAQCIVSGSEVTIKDLGSSNGIYVNGEKVESATLADGDTIGLGRFKLFFESGGEMDDTVVEAEPIAETGSYDDLSDEEETGPAEPVQFDTEDSGSISLEGDEEENEEEEESDGHRDDTPVDMEFAPVKYEPQQGMTVGPQLVQRDGKWFLKDPTTNREVEIVPKWEADGEAPPDAEAVQADLAKTKKMRLMLSAIGAIVIILFLAVVLMKPPPPKPGPPAYSKEDYNANVDKAVILLDQGEINDALLIFKSANEKLPNRQVAAILIEIAYTTKSGNEDESQMDWEHLGNLFHELKQSVFCTSKAELYANRQLEWVDKHLSQKAIVARAIRKLKAGSPESAWADFQKVAVESPARIEAKEEIQDTARQCIRIYVNKAKDAETEGKWDEAAINYQKASTFSDVKDSFELEIDNCREWKSHSQLIEQARQAIEDERLKDVQALLEKVKDSSPYFNEAELLITSASEKVSQQVASQLSEKVKSLYDAGKGEEALTLIASKKAPVTERLSETIRKVVEAMKTANQAYEKKDYDAARENWKVVLDLEENKENEYNQMAMRRLQKFEFKRQEIARDYERQAEKAEEKGNFQEARKFFHKAQNYDPEGRLGREGLERLNSLARTEHIKGSVAMAKGENETALKAFKRVLEIAESGSYHYNDARKKLLRLEQ